MKTESYDPSFFIEKELFLEELRAKAQGESEEYQEFVYELTEAYAHILDLLRQFYDSYDERSRKKAWKRFTRAATTLFSAIEEANAMMRGDENEVTTDAH